MRHWWRPARAGCAAAATGSVAGAAAIDAADPAGLPAAFDYKVFTEQFDEVVGAAVAKIVAVHARDHDVG